MTWNDDGARRSPVRPRLFTDAPDDTLARLYRAALACAFVTNVSGSEPDGTFLRAGGTYPDPWTRDAAINCWNAASLLHPGLAERTLRKVVERTADGQEVIAQDDQWWDQVIWVVGAWHHAVVTGDAAFARWACDVGQASVRILEGRYEASQGLYRGGAVMQDGISGYPFPVADRAGDSSFVLDHPEAHRVMCLSTNVVYAAAFRKLAELARLAGTDARPYDARAGTVAASVRRRFWDAASGTFGYLIRPDGRLDRHQETAGLALAVEFGVSDRAQTERIFATAHREPMGMPLVWPAFTRYTRKHPGRHNVMIWPMVEGLWGVAAAKSGRLDHFGRSLADLLRLVAGSADRFYEVYDATDGRVDGGWQVGRAWASVPDQTWSATALLRMVHEGLVGLRFHPDGLRLAPALVEPYRELRLDGLPYRGATLDVHLVGQGTRIRSALIDGVPAARSAAGEVDLRGVRDRHEVVIVLEP